MKIKNSSSDWIAHVQLCVYMCVRGLVLGFECSQIYCSCALGCILTNIYT